MASRFVLVASAEQYLFNLLAGNHEKILTSERYTSRASAVGGISAVRANAPIDARYDRRTSRRGEPYFVLRAANHEVIGTSEMYSSAWARDEGIAAVKANATAAVLDDQT
jgi:uncharacterized protein YegP (UPF0339 family)